MFIKLTCQINGSNRLFHPPRYGVIFWFQNTLIVKVPLKKILKLKNRIFQFFYIQIFPPIFKKLKKTPTVHYKS